MQRGGVKAAGRGVAREGSAEGSWQDGREATAVKSSVHKSFSDRQRGRGSALEHMCK